MIKIVCSKCDGEGRIPDYYEPDYDSHECEKCNGHGYYYLDINYDDKDIILEDKND